MANPPPDTLTDDKVCPRHRWRELYCHTCLWANRAWYEGFKEAAERAAEPDDE